MIKPKKLNIGDTIGIVAPSNPIIDENIEEMEKAKRIVEKIGFKIKYSKNLFLNTNQYSSTAKEKAEDINDMFKDNDVKMIWCAKGGENSNSIFEYLDYELISKNPKIICGYSDITSLVNIIAAKTNIVTFNGTNFKTIATDMTEYSLNQAIDRFVNGSLRLGQDDDKYICINSGVAEGTLIGGNLSLMCGMICGKYKVDLKDKILFIEELGYESDPALVSNHLYYMKQNGVFNEIRGIWLGNYEHETGISLEKILLDTLKDEYSIPIIKSNNFGHTERKTVIPIGIKAKINTNEKNMIKLMENCINS